ncbi:MAG: hypothetical protein ACQKBV_10225 [Puniceicoccales bacterium]
MKFATAVLSLILLAAFGYLMSENYDLRKQVAALNKTTPLTVPGGSDITTRDVKTLLLEMQLELREDLEKQQAAITRQLEAERELQAKQQRAVLEDFINSEEFADRTWTLLYGYVLDFLHPENQIAIREELAAQSRGPVKVSSRKEAVANNLRQIAAAGQQYILETGESKVNYRQLEGDYFRAIAPVNGERYIDLTVVEEGGTLRATLDDGTVVEYTY